MYIIIIGCGRLGSNLALELANEGHDVCVLERDGLKLENLGSNFNGKRVKGIEFDSDKLIEAGIEYTDAVLAVSPDDNINLTVSLIAGRIYKIKKVIARVNNPKTRSLYKQLEIDTVNPIKYESDIIKNKLSLDCVKVISILEKEYELIEVHITRDKEIAICELEKKYNCVVAFIKRNEIIQFPKPNDVIHFEDRIILGIKKSDEMKVINYLSKELAI